MDAERHRVAVVAGICTRYDAISNAVRHQVDVLSAAGYDVTVFVQHSDFPELGHVVVDDSWQLMRDETFRSAEIVIYHHGIHYGLFDTLALSHPSAVRVVNFHNMTPPDLLSESSRSQVIRGIDQLELVSGADAVWCDSAHNAEALAEWVDTGPVPVSVLPLCVPWLEEPRSQEYRPSTPVRMLAVGRLCAAKGQDVLLRALALVSAEVLERTELELVASREHSDMEFHEHLVEMADSLGLGDRVRFSLDLSDGDLRERYDRAAVFVSPSLHEGFCIPVIEALSHGCMVVTTDAGALPETVGRCGTTVPAGDEVSLARSLEKALCSVATGECSVPAPVLGEHLSKYSAAAHRSRTLEALAELSPATTR